MNYRSALMPVLVLWGVAAVILWAAIALPTLNAFAGGVLVCGVATAWLHGWLRSRQQQAEVVTSSARHLLEVAAQGPGAAAPPPVAAFQDMGDLAELSRVLDDLGARLTGQVRELAKKSRNLESLIDGLDEPVLVTGDDRTILLCNRAAEALVEARPGALIGRSFDGLFTRQELLDMHASARAGKARHGRVRLTTPSGVRVMQVSASPLPAAWGVGIFGAIVVLRDVTELAMALSLQSDFVANASHELRTPVSAIGVAIETLQDGAKEEPAMRDRLLGVCASHCQRLQEMIRDLMDLSRMESPDMPVRFEPISLSDLEASLRQNFEGICTTRNITLDFQIKPGLSAVRSDRKLLPLILRNLIDNATKFADPGTAVQIRIAPSASPDAETPGLRLEVSDRGAGIPLAQQSRVFERFYQVDPARTGTGSGGGGGGGGSGGGAAGASRRGTGLGLAIVKQACTALGGTVGLDSVWGQGTTVWVELPAPPQPAGESPIS